MIELGLVAASDLHKEIGKNQEILSDALNKEFEAPLQRNVAAHVKKVQENESAYEKKMKGIQDDIGKAEKKMLAGI